ncbi:MAG: c-type cytochrome [Saprospiraceae bacterium]|jgi:cytochrome c2|nr:c-type cytochrome [Saprospiraceae bacterium]
MIRNKVLKFNYSGYFCTESEYKNSQSNETNLYPSIFQYFMSCKSVFNIIVILLLQSLVLIAAPSIDAGKASFKNNCASCHNKNMKDNLTGPALAGVEARWSAFPKADLYSWIRNSQGLIAKGHPRAVELYNTYNKLVMTAFPAISDEEIESILLYIDCTAKGTCGPKDVAGTPGAANANASNGSGSNFWMYMVFAILAILAIFLWNIITDLNHTRNMVEGDTDSIRPNFWNILTNKSVITFVLFGLVLFGGYTTVNNAISLGRQQNYAPDQPIKFSHQTHAGLHKIDCNYCHDGARRSKQSVIPGVSTCMNCHKAIKKGTKYGTAEITKIFAAIGFDPSTDKYIENYEKLSNEDIEKIYKKWMSDEAKKDTKSVVDVDQQWSDVVGSLTNESKKTIAGPIEWIRIHNLPDHVYFNHSQHVTIGKIECQKCHGKVEEMDVLRQYSPLSMGWCINCHRQTDVKFQDNKYYDSYKTYHDELKAGTRKSVKVSDIGGLECQKCHY